MAPNRIASISAQGRGRFVGLVLQQLASSVSDSFSLIAGVARYCPSPGCASGPADKLARGAFHGERDEEGNILIPAGAYDLYLLADGSPARVTLRLGGVEGTARFNLSTRVEYEILSPSPELFEANTKTIYSHGRTIPFGDGSGGLALDIIRVEAESWIGGRYGICLYGGDPVGPPQFAYGPGCLVAGPSIVDGSMRLKPHVLLDAWQVLFEPSGTYGLGHYYSTAGSVAQVWALSLNLTLG